MFRFNLSLFSKKFEKIGFWILLGICGIVAASGAFFWLNFKKLLPEYSFSFIEQQPKQKGEQEISPEIKEFGIKIDKIGILAPVIKDVDGSKKSVYNQALEKGVAHYKGTSLPGQGSNIFIFGHSSTVLGKGPYAKIFARLPELDKNDEIIVYYRNKEFKYYIFGKMVVQKTDLNVLRPTKKEQLTLMTCWPIGTNEKRLIIKAHLKQ